MVPAAGTGDGPLAVMRLRSGDWRSGAVRPVAVLRGRGCGREPGAVGEQHGEGVEGVDAPFGGGGQAGLDDREVGEPEEGAPGPAGGALLDLDRADVALGLVGGEADGQVGGEAQDHVLVVAEPAGQPRPVQGDLGAFPLVVGDALGDGAAVPGADAGEVAVAEGGLPRPAGGAGAGVGVDEQVGHRPCPDLPFGVEAVQPGQVAQPVGAAPGVQRAGEVLVSLVAVSDDGAAVTG